MFYITISNGLLKGHRKRMGSAVWEFMWLLDKVTMIDEKGSGKVLGGKPINLDDLAKDLESGRSTVSENLTKLEEEKYITKLHTPYGIQITVCKAKKSFRKEVSEKPKPRSENTKPRSENADPNKTVHKTRQKTDTGAEAPSDPNIPLIIDLFKEVNPSYSRLFAMPPQRKAVERLLATHGFDKLSAMISFLPKSNATKYAPTITTPSQFEAKLGELIAWSQKQKDTSTSKKANVV